MKSRLAMAFDCTGQERVTGRVVSFCLVPRPLSRWKDFPFRRVHREQLFRCVSPQKDSNF